MSVIGSNVLAGASGQAVGAAGYEIERSLRFNSADSAYLNRTPSSAGNRDTWTLSWWMKRSKLSNNFQTIFGVCDASATYYTQLRFGEADKLSYQEKGSANGVVFETEMVFRDVASWYHCVFVFNNTASSNSEKARLYVNGSEVTSFSTDNRSQIGTTSTAWNNNVQHNISHMRPYSGSFDFDGYLAEVHFVDGQALDPTDFGEYDDNNVWQPKAFAGSYGTNGFHLDFSDNSSNAALGYDAAGSNDWTVNNLSVASGAGNDSLIDTPTNYEADSGNNGGNYCTLNPLESALTALNNGNLNSGSSGAASWKICTSTLAVSSGKYYWEGFTDTTADSSKGWQFGFCQVGPSSLTTPYGTGKWSYQAGNIYNQSSTATSVGTTAVANDLLAYALDMDAGTCKLYVNNSLVHTFTGITGTITPFVGSYNTPTVTVNFGQRPFAYTPPTNHLSLCTTNLPDPTIADGSTAFDVITYSGTDTTRTFTGFNFSPDMTWFKCRSTAYDHILFDSVRGTTKRLKPNSTAAEDTNSTGLTAFTSDGFTVGGADSVNGPSSDTYVAWCWDAGTSTVSNTDGSITSSVRTNGYLSIVTYTGTGTAATVGHNLGVAPQLIIAKNRDISSSWSVYHTSLGKDYFLRLNTTDAQVNSANYWGTGGMTSTVFGIDSGIFLNTNTEKVVAYCFAPVEGYSAFGSYTGNGSADGPFVYTGMRPKWLLLKRTDSAKSWQVIDTERSAHNVTDDRLFPDDAGAESSSSNFKLDILSNGFKCRTAHDSTNVSGGTYIYAAFAEHPFKTARAR